VSGIDTGDFSSLVVETFDGSVIVEGTLAADRLAADTAVVNGLSVESELSVGTSGVLRSGKTAFNTGTGWYLDFNGGTPRFDLGDPSGNNLQWNGTSLSVTGTINIENPADVRTDINVADGATNNGSTVNTSGNIAGSMTMLSGGSIVVGNITIDGTNSRILITD
jgi:hypothetical protein